MLERILVISVIVLAGVTDGVTGGLTGAYAQNAAPGDHRGC